MKRMKIVILGAGFGGVRLAQLLAPLIRAGQAVVTIIDQESHHLYTPSLYEIVAGVSPKQVCLPLTDCLRQTGVRLIEGRVTALKIRSERVVLQDKTEVGYDQVVLALGSVTNFYGIKGLPEYAYPLKTLRDAWLLRRHIESEFADAVDDPKRVAERKLNFLIAGGGSTGVELAGELALYRRRLAEQFGVPLEWSRIELIEAGPRILGRADKKTALLASRRLHELGVVITTKTAVKEEHVRSVVLLDQTRQSETLIWAAGVAPHPLVATLGGLEHDRRGLLLVDGYLRAHGRSNVWVIGDLASTPDAGTAQTALRHADHVAANLRATLTGEPLSVYEPVRPYLVMPIGHGYGVAELGNWVFGGWLASVLRRLVDLRYLARILPFSQALRVWLARHKPCPNCHARLRDMVWAGGRIA